MSDIEKTLTKKFGNNVFFSGDQLLEKETTVVPVGPALDIILGGGIPQGSFVTLSGPPKVGKSSLALHVAKNAQKLGMKVYYFNVEGRLKPRDVQGIVGLKTDLKNLEIIGSTKDKILYAEDYMDILLSYITTKQKCLFIFDSFSQLCTAARQANEVGKRFRDDAALLLADMTKRVSNILPITENILIGTVHLIANQNPASRSLWTESAGNKIKYQADVRLKAPYQESYTVGDQQIGQLVHWEAECTALHAPPNQKTKSLLRYGYGLDEEYEILTLGIDIGFIVQAGAWITFPNGEKQQGKEKARQYLVDNPKIYEEVKNQLYEMLGIL